jgi:predicted ATPase/DNA-binding SARP family transcriptional activator
MTRLDLTLFGPPTISIDGVPLNSRVDKAVALVALLALQGPTMHRDALIANLWTGSDNSKAHAALRTAIWRLKQSRLSPWLDVDRERISLNTEHDLWLDIAEFMANLKLSKTHAHDADSACPICFPLLNRAVELYRGDFMSGYSPRNANGFDDWRTDHTNILRSDYLNTLERLVKGYYQDARYGQALQIARRWLAIDQYNEEAHNLLLRIYASNGQRANAIAQYRSYKRLVEKNLGIEPSSEITALYKHILTGKTPPADSTNRLKNPVILLLDIAHSAELWIRHRDLMDKVLTRFIHIIKDSLHHCGGRIIQQYGDQFSLLFDRGQPLQCAMGIQQLVAQTKWGLSEPLSVRIAINTFPNAPPSSSEYSTELSICKHLLQAASGNQILITDRAINHLEFPVSVRSNNLGSYLIPGQLNPLQIFELVQPNFPGIEHRYLSNLTRSPANIPIQATRFIGRETELGELAYLLAQPECRMLTLIGPGGVGKTRLGIQAISQIQVPQPDGIYYISLVSHLNPTTIYNPIAEALNLSFNNPGDQVAQLIDHLRYKRMLLLLDNFEHLLPATSFLIQLLEAAPGLRIMLTSRERLNLHMETIFEVRGLPFPHRPDDPDFEHYSAVQLFIQNARRVSPGFALHTEDKASLIRICILVEGLPLGIELSSSWVRAFSCQEIANAIQLNLDFVRTNSSDVPTRHRSLRAAFDHSWGLLSEEARRITGKLSIFRNGFSPQAAEHLAHATPIMLASLVDKSILARQSNGRFLMPETLRVYVIEKNKTDLQEYESLLDIHSEYFVNYLAGMLVLFAGENGASAVKELWLDADNIRAALNRAMDRHQWSNLLKSIDPLMSFFELQGRFREGRDNTIAIMNRVTDLIGMQQPDIYYSLLGWDGVFSFRLGFTQEGLEKLKTRLEYAQRKGDMVYTANTLLTLADAHRRLGKLNTAIQEINQSLEILEPLSNSENQLLLGFYANALTILGLIQLRLGQLQDARQSLYRSSAVLEKSGTRYVRIRLLDLQSRIAIMEQRYEESLNLRLEALAIAEDFNDRRNIGILMNNLGACAEHLGDLRSALAYVTKADQISNEIGDRHMSALSNNNLGHLTLQLKYPPLDAIPYYQKSLAMYREIYNTLGIFLTLRDISQAYLLAHSVTPAQAHLTEALHLGIELNEPHLVLQLLPNIARLQAQLGQPARAVQLCSIAINHPKTSTDLRERAQQLIAEFSPQSDADSPLLISTDLELPTFQSLLAEIDQ